MDKISDEFKNCPDRIINLRVTFPWLLKKYQIDSHQHNLFSFDQIFLKLADKVDMDEISARSHHLSKSYVPLIVEKDYSWLYHQHYSFSFDWISLELPADQMEKNETVDKFKNCPDQVIYYRVTNPWFLKLPIFDLVMNLNASVFYQIFLNLTYKIRLKLWSTGRPRGDAVHIILKLK